MQQKSFRMWVGAVACLFVSLAPAGLRAQDTQIGRAHV